VAKHEESLPSIVMILFGIVLNVKLAEELAVEWYIRTGRGSAKTLLKFSAA
jgi:hypothetical protein